MPEKSDYKIQHKLHKNQSKIRIYKSLIYGDGSFLSFVYFEIVTMILINIPGALGIMLRGIFYRPFFKKPGKGLLIGRNVLFRHPKSIEVGDNVVFDENSVIDAKGSGNTVHIGNNVYIGRNTIISCKNGDILLEENVNIGHNCIVFSSYNLIIGSGTMIAAYCHILSGGEYDYESSIPFCEQTGKIPSKPTYIGKNCWLGSDVTVVSEKVIGDHCVIGAKSLVSKDIPSDSIAFGTRIKVYRKI